MAIASGPLVKQPRAIQRYIHTHSRFSPSSARCALSMDSRMKRVRSVSMWTQRASTKNRCVVASPQAASHPTRKPKSRLPKR